MLVPQAQQPDIFKLHFCTLISIGIKNASGQKSVHSTWEFLFEDYIETCVLQNYLE